MTNVDISIFKGFNALKKLSFTSQITYSHDLNMIFIYNDQDSNSSSVIRSVTRLFNPSVLGHFGQSTSVTNSFNT